MKINQYPFVALAKIIAEATPGFACGQRDPKGIAQVRMHNISKEFALVWETVTRIPKCAFKPQHYLLPGDIVFNNTNSAALVGKSALFVGGKEPIVFSNHMTRLRVDREICLPEFLLLYLRDRWNQGLFSRICARWIGQSAIRSAKLMQLSIPLPPMAEQRRIVARLRQDLQDCGEICRVAESQSKNARAFPALLLRDIFRQVNHFPMVVLSDLCDVLRGVAFSANQSHNSPFAGSVACATTKSVQEEVDWESCRHIPAGVVKNHARILQVGDILISIANSKELVGKISVVRAIPFRATFGAFVAVLRSNKCVLPEFLALYLRAPQVKRYFYIHSSNTTNISNLNMRRVMAMPVALPSLAEQRRLVNYSRAQLKNGTDISVVAERRLESARALPQAFLRRAFSRQ